MTWTSTPEHTPCGAVLHDKPGIVTCIEDKARCERCDKWECPKCNHWPDNPLADVCPDCLVTVVTELRDERDELKQSVKSLVEQRDDYRGKMLYERELRQKADEPSERRDDLLDQLMTARAELAEARVEISDLSADLKGSRAETEELRRRVAAVIGKAAEIAEVLAR